MEKRVDPRRELASQVLVDDLVRQGDEFAVLIPRT
jgi:hypothetical protein